MIDCGWSPDRSTDVALVLTTFGDRKAAVRVVTQLLEERLVVCANVIPGVQSIYWWEGQIANEEEVIVLLKFDKSSIDRLYQRVTELHTYAVPELVELPLGAVSLSYARWVIESFGVKA